MATPAELEAVVVLAIDEALTDPQITQVSEVNPIEQDLRVSSEDMQPDGLRQRVIHGHSDNSSSQQGDGPINSEERLTPISNAGTKQTQGKYSNPVEYPVAGLISRKLKKRCCR
jgi:hypothetical protein